jgi:hypothetical protein
MTLLAGQSSARPDDITLRQRQGQLSPARVSRLLATGGNTRVGTHALSAARPRAFAFAANPDKVQTMRALNSPRCASSNVLNPGAAAAPRFTAVPSYEITGPSVAPALSSPYSFPGQQPCAWPIITYQSVWQV